MFQCMSSNDLVSTVNSQIHHDHSEKDNHHLLNSRTMQLICPILLYQKVANMSIQRDGCLIELKDKHSNSTKAPESRVRVWVYSGLSIIAISACGLLGVAVIPIMHKTYYEHLLQFLVALAVGTLCGDALLHLMPHAMSPMEHSHDTALSEPASHDDGMWKGLAAMLGVVFFYFTEKGLNVIVEWRKRRQKLDKERKLPSRVRVLKDEATNSTKGAVNILRLFKKEKEDPMTKTCKHKYSEYPYCYDEIETDTHNDHHHRDGQAPDSPKGNNTNAVSVVSSNAVGEAKDNEPNAKDWLLKSDSKPSVVEMNNMKHKEDGVGEVKGEESYTVILR